MQTSNSLIFLPLATLPCHHIVEYLTVYCTIQPLARLKRDTNISDWIDLVRGWNFSVKLTMHKSLKFNNGNTRTNEKEILTSWLNGGAAAYLNDIQVDVGGMGEPLLPAIGQGKSAYGGFLLIAWIMGWN